MLGLCSVLSAGPRENYTSCSLAIASVTFSWAFHPSLYPEPRELDAFPSLGSDTFVAEIFGPSALKGAISEKDVGFSTGQEP